jgi:hypothetical protein
VPGCNGREAIGSGGGRRESKGAEGGRQGKRTKRERREDGDKGKRRGGKARGESEEIREGETKDGKWRREGKMGE